MVCLFTVMEVFRVAKLITRCEHFADALVQGNLSKLS